MDLLHYNSDSDSDATENVENCATDALPLDSDVSRPVPRISDPGSDSVPSPTSTSSTPFPIFVTYLENYNMKQKHLASIFPFLLCDLPQAHRTRLRPKLAASLRAIDRTIQGFSTLYDMENTVDQISLGVLGATNTAMMKRLHITLFPLIQGKPHQLAQLEQNIVRCMHAWAPPKTLVCQPNVLDSMLGAQPAGRLRLALEPRLLVLTLKTPNVVFVTALDEKNAENDAFFKGLSALIGEQADALSLSYKWWKSVGVRGIDDSKYHVSFLTYNVRRPGTAISLKQVSELQAALDALDPLPELSVDVDSLILGYTSTEYRRIPLVRLSP